MQLEKKFQKFQNWILPDTLIALGDMQNMLRSSSRLWAKIIPAAIAAGSAGGTQTVIKSKVCIITCNPVSPFFIYIS
jgi:hypothetical protein